MFEWILLGIGILGFGLAGYWDLRTTEFPDSLPYSIIIAALGIRGVWAWVSQDASIFLDSLYVGAGLLGFGLLLFILKQWGDGDAWLLGAMGFLFPMQSGLPMLRPAVMTFPFPLVLLFNFFFISFIYLIFYSLGVGLRTKGVIRKFSRELKGSMRKFIAAFSALFAACLAVTGYLTINLGIPPGKIWIIMVLPFFLLAMLVFLQYGKYIENNVFKRKIPASKIKPGDVPIGSKWRVLSDSEVENIKELGEKVWIKEGVRLAPVFLITLLVAVFWGTLFF